MAGDTPTIKLKKTKSKLSESTAASRANSPTSSIAGDSITAKSRAYSPATAGGTSTPVDETNTLCKHCKNYYNKAIEPNHSKLCLRAKQERQRKKREEKEKAEEADQSITLSTTNDSQIATESTEAPAASAATTSKSKKAAAATTDKPDKKQNKKRKATDTDTASVAGDTSTTGTMKPPTKKQKKKDAAATSTSAPSATPAPTTAADTASVRDTPAPTTKPSTSTTTSKAEKASTSTAKPKAPVDVEKQCGVPLVNGGLCARSLTCKSHAMGAKRAVPGRSLPYDILLAQYQKKNQAKLQKAAMERNAAEEREREGMEEGGEGGRVDSEEEVERVMTGLGRWAPKPLVQWGDGMGGGGVWGGVGRRTKGIRFREQLGEALKGHRGNNLFSVAPRGQAQQDGGVGEAGSVNEAAGADVQTHSRKASTIAVA